MISANIVKNDGREYLISLDKIGFIKSRIIKSGNEIDGVPLTFTPKCELLAYSSTKKYPMQFTHIYFSSREEALSKYKIIVNIFTDKGLEGFVEYIKNVNPNTFIQKGDSLYSTSNNEFARMHLDFV